MASPLHKAIAISAALALPACQSLKWGAEALPEGAFGASGAVDGVAAEVARLRRDRVITDEFKHRYPKAAQALEELCEAQLPTLVSATLKAPARELVSWRRDRLEVAFTDALVEDLADAGRISREEKRGALPWVARGAYGQRVVRIFDECGLTVPVVVTTLGNGAHLLSISVSETRPLERNSPLYATVAATRLPDGVNVTLQEKVLLARTDDVPNTFSLAALSRIGDSAWSLMLNRADIDGMSENLKVDRTRCEATLVAGLCGWLIGNEVVRDPMILARAKDLKIEKDDLIEAIQHYYGARFGDADVKFRMLLLDAGGARSTLACDLVLLGKGKAPFSSSERDAVLAEFEALFEQIGFEVPGEEG